MGDGRAAVDPAVETSLLAVSFPPDFLWGAATSAYQIEGAVGEDGRVESIWDRFAHTPGAVRGGDTGDVACDHYHRWESDLDLMASIGLRAYRFSIAWPRILGGGAGAVNREGVAFYRRLVQGLLDRGITPVATLYHWDLPLFLQEAGGWGSRETPERFAEYASVAASELGDLVPMWVTVNEPWVAAFFGHGTGVHAPGIKDWPAAFAAFHQMLRAHGLAARAVRTAAGPTAKVGISLDLYPVDAATDSPEDLAAARRMDLWRNRWCLDPLLRREYPGELMHEIAARWGPVEWLRPGDLDDVAVPVDFLGINYYQRSHVRAGGPDSVLGIEAVPATPPLTAAGWEVTPERLTEVLLRVRRDYGDLPIFITENGAAYDDVVAPGGGIEDSARIDFLHGHVQAIASAREQGADVRGYFVWSLLDNFEWSEGYSKRFGLVHVDFETQRRTPKSSAGWYRGLIRGS